jgi:Animal haem peroxidase.
MGGRFTRLFPYLPSARFAQHDLERLAHEMTAPKDTDADTEPDPEENPGIPAAYTYLGQFVDHDLTFDPISHLRETLTGAQLRALVDFRTPRFDLDNLYGRGPDDQPYMYKKDGIRMLLGESMSGKPFDPGAVQLPRGPSGRALIGDPRNDENRIVAQLHAIFLRFHNRVVHKMGGRGTSVSGKPASRSDGTTSGSWSTTSCPGSWKGRRTRVSSRTPTGLCQGFRGSGRMIWSSCRWSFRWGLTASGTPWSVPSTSSTRISSVRSSPTMAMTWGDFVPSRRLGHRLAVLHRPRPGCRA